MELGASPARHVCTRLMVAVLVALAVTASSHVPTAFASNDWQELVSPPFGTMSSIQFIDAEHGSVTADGPYWTADGGRTWSPGEITWGGSAYLDTMFYDAQHGWCVGGALAASTSDGGRHWTSRPLVGLNFPDYDGATRVWFSDSLHGWIAGGFGIATTSDSGNHWKLQSTGDFGSYQPTAIRFSDSLHGCAVNEAGELLTTRDGGAHWTSRIQPLEFALTSIAFRDPTHAFVGGPTGLLLVDLNSTAAAQQVAPLFVGAECLSFVDAQHGWAGSQTEVWSTVDGGKTWVPRDPHLLQPIVGMSFSDTSHGWVIGSAGGIASTSDGGAHWTTLNRGAGDIYQQPVFADATHGWMISSSLTFGDAGIAPGTSALWGTTDAGQHWEPLLGGIRFGQFPAFQIFDAVGPWQSWMTDYPVAVSFADTATGCAACISGKVYFTGDGGRTWGKPSVLDAHSYLGLAALTSADASHAWALTRTGGVYATAGGGLTWKTQRGSAAEDYRYPSGQIKFADANHGCAMLTDGTLLYTVDGGTHWASSEATADFAPNYLSVADAHHAWLAASGVPLLFSGDSGATWVPHSAPTTSDISSVAFSDALHGHLVAREPDAVAPLVMVTDDGGSTWSTETAPPFMWAANELAASDPSHAWAVGAFAGVFRRRTVEPLTDLEPYPTGWVSHPVDVSLTATVGSGGSATADTYYRLDGGSTQHYGPTFPISYEGTTSVEYWSVDASGNVEPTETALVRIDTTPPEVTLDVSGSPYRGAGVPKVNAVDSLSGVDFVQRWFDGGAPGTFGPNEEWAPGSHTIHVRAVDNAGNERILSAGFTVLPPFACRLTKPALSVTPRRGRKFLVTGRVTPAHVTPLTLVIERRRNGRWRAYAKVSARSVSSGAWRARLALPSGSFRMRAVTPRLPAWAGATSSWRAFAVR